MEKNQYLIVKNIVYRVSKISATKKLFQSLKVILMNHLVFLLCLGVNTVFGTAPAASSSFTSRPLQEDQTAHIVRTLVNNTNVTIECNADAIKFKGPETDVRTALARIADFNHLRRTCLPVDSRTAMTQSCPIFRSWTECVAAIGIRTEEFGLFNPAGAIDDTTSGAFKLPMNSDFNTAVSEAYLNALKTKSMFFKWAFDNLKDAFVTNEEDGSGTFKVIRYGVLREFLNINIEQLMQEAVEASRVVNASDNSDTGTETEEDDDSDDDIFAHFREMFSGTNLSGQHTVVSGNSGTVNASHSTTIEASITKSGFLKRLIAATSGPVSLRQTSRVGEFEVCTTSLGQGSNPNSFVDIMLDVSGSINGIPIDTVNAQMPTLLERLRSTITTGGTMTVNVFGVNDQIRELIRYTFGYGETNQITWINVTASGGTDLTHIGRRTILQPGEANKAVIAFTDGAHNTGGSLSDLKRDIATAKSKGRFASTTFCRVTTGKEEDTLFPQLGAELAGTFFDAKNMGQFFEAVNTSAADITRAQRPLVLALGGAVVSVFQRDDTPGIYGSGNTLLNGQSVTYSGQTQTVHTAAAAQHRHVDPANIDDDEAAKLRRIAELQAELAALQAQLVK